MKFELINDHFENAKRYNIPRAQLIIADIPYNLGNNAYASDPRWYENGDNKTVRVSWLENRFLTQTMILKSIISLIFAAVCLKKSQKKKGKRLL